MRLRSEHDIFIENELEEGRLTFKMRRLIKQAITRALEFEGYQDRAEISVTITDNVCIRDLNKRYRNIDRSTDVLSFPLDDSDELEHGGPDTNVLGDIVISLDTAERQAEEYGHSLEREVCFLAVHSVLHLLGYDHMTPEDEQDMFSRQKIILDDMGLKK